MAKVAQYLFTARRVLPAMALGPFTASGRARLRDLARKVGWEQERGPWPIRSIREVVGSVQPVTLFVPHERQPDNATGFELACLAQLVRWKSPKAIFEFGTFDGRTSANLLLNAPADARLFTLNLPPEQFRHASVSIGECIAPAGVGGRSTQLFGDTLTFDYSAYRGTIDFVFIDAGHSYECVANDSKRALELANGRGCVIAWHDYGQIAEVTRAADDFVRANRLDSRTCRIEGTSILIVETFQI